MKRILFAFVTVVCASAPAAIAGETDQEKFVKALDRMMVALGPESARDAKAIQAAYRAHLDLLVLDEYSSVERALYTGGLARVPSDSPRFNLTPRVTGRFPIGEKDLNNQTSYIAARPATIGALLSVASRVRSGPIEVTSLVRHSEYQGALRKTNPNATTSVPMHTMGLAFDIGLVNTPLTRAYEIRGVLREMRKAGEILFIGERQQLVFHVVPHPSRLGYFTDVYTRALGAPPAAQGTPVVGFSSFDSSGRGIPSVTAEVIDIIPAGEFAEEWWAAGGAHGDLIVDVTPAPGVPAAASLTLLERPGTTAAAPFLLLFAGALGVFSYRRSNLQEPVIVKTLLNS